MLSPVPEPRPAAAGAVAPSAARAAPLSAAALAATFAPCPSAAAAGTAPVNALSVDVEDWFQVSAFERCITRADWPALESRVERNTDVLLALFDAARVRATFFVLGWIAERHPGLVRRIVAQGHELGSHGYDHTLVTQFDRAAFRADVLRTRALLEDLGGVAVAGYRAPTFSIGRHNLWALEVLRECGHRYSSSIYPVRHDLYGFPEAPRFACVHRPSGLIEIPITTVRLLGRNLPCGGGGFFRLYPYAFTRWLMREVNRRDRRPCVFYMHPWEVDAAQPRPKGVPARARFRHYLNLEHVPARLERMLRDFRWGRMDEVYLSDAHATAH